MNIDSKTTDMNALPTHSGDESAKFARLLADIKGIISEVRSAAYVGINAVQVDHNWRIGRRIVIVEEEQDGKIRGIRKAAGASCARNM